MLYTGEKQGAISLSQASPDQELKGREKIKHSEIQSALVRFSWANPAVKAELWASMRPFTWTSRTVYVQTREYFFSQIDKSY